MRFAPFDYCRKDIGVCVCVWGGGGGGEGGGGEGEPIVNVLILNKEIIA